jgi:DNA-binding transcriptional regulator PaaX
MNQIKTVDVLKVLGIGAIVLGSVAIPGLPVALASAHKMWKNINKKDLGRIIKRLERQEMIKISEQGNKTAIEITEKGKKRLLEYDFENIELKSQRRDGKWRMVIFDIPETKRNSRDVFRRKLVQLNFTMLQESVFASAFPCKKEIDFLCHYLGISDYVTLVKLDSIERGEKLIFKQF